MDDFEVALAPDFASDNPYEVLGCPDTADPEAIDRAYRDLCRKYHPDRSDPLDSNSAFIFQRISQAYAQAKGDVYVPRTVDDAKRAYEDVYGKYRCLYYNEGGVIGIPYANDLKERLEETKDSRELLSLSCGRFKFMFFRTWLIKEDLSWSLWLCEVVLTWVVISLCVLAYILENNPDIWEIATKNGGRIIDIAGGVALMIAQFILCFWYGFTRYPAGDQSYIDWLRYGEKALSINNKTVVDQDMQNIRRVCSYYLHQDKTERFHPVIFLICFPVVLIEQIPAFACASLVRVALWISHTRENNSRRYALHVSNSFAALLVVVGYYILWVYGDNHCKAGATVGLLVSQNLYNAVLFEKSVFEFLQSFIFGNAFLVTINKGTVHKKMKPDLDPRADTSTDSSNQSRKQLRKTTTGHKRVSYAGVVNLETGSVIEFGNITGDSGGEVLTIPRATSGLFTLRQNDILRSSSFISLPTPETPSTVRDLDSSDETIPDHGENACMDLTNIDMGGIEVLHEKDVIQEFEETQEPDIEASDTGIANPVDDSLNAEEILQDLGDTETSMVSAYKQIKRNLESSFYSCRVRVVSGLDSNSDHTDDDNSSRSELSLSRIDKRDSSCIGTISLDGGSRGFVGRDDDSSVTDDIESGYGLEVNIGTISLDGGSRGFVGRDDDGSLTDDIESGYGLEVNNQGIVLDGGEDVVSDIFDTAIRKDAEPLNGSDTFDTAIRKDAEPLNRKRGRNLSVREWMFRGRPPKEESNDFSPDSQIVDDDESDKGLTRPPVQTVYAETEI